MTVSAICGCLGISDVVICSVPDDGIAGFFLMRGLMGASHIASSRAQSSSLVKP